MGLFTRSGTTVTDWLGKLILSADLTKAEEKILKERARHAAVKEMALYTAVGLVADLISGCEIQIFENGTPVRKNIWYLFNVSASPNQTSAQLIAKWITTLYYKGEALIVPLSNNLFVADSFSRDEYPVKGDVFRNVCIGNFQSKKTFRADNVYYLKQDNPQLRKLFNDVFDVYAELLEYSRKSSGQGSGEKYAIQTGAYASGNPENEKKYMEMVQDRLSRFVEAESAALPLSKDQTIQRLSAANVSTTSDYMSLRKDVYAVVAEAMHLPAGLLDGSLTSVDQVLNQALTTAIDPLVNKMNQELTRKTFTADEVLSGSRIWIDTTSLKHVDVLDVSDKIDKLISSGFMCIDEVRDRCKVPKLNTDWSIKHFITKNYEGIEGTDPLEGGE